MNTLPPDSLVWDTEDIRSACHDIGPDGRCKHCHTTQQKGKETP